MSGKKFTNFQFVIHKFPDFFPGKISGIAGRDGKLAGIWKMDWLTVVDGGPWSNCVNSLFVDCFSYQKKSKHFH